MNPVDTNGKERFRTLLILLKVYVIFGPLLLVALIRGVHLDGDMAVHLLAVGYALTFVTLLFASIGQSSSGLRKSAYWSFVFAGVSLLWIMVLLVLLPSLAST